MLCFEVLVNGTKLALAGVDPYGVLDARVSWQRDNPTRFMDAMQLGPSVSVSGRIDHGVLNKPVQYEIVHWDGLGLTVGDEVVIRIRDADTPDVPGSRQWDTIWENMSLQEKLGQYRRVKKHYERLKKDLEAAGETV